MMAYLLAGALALNVATFVFTAAYKDIVYKAEINAVRVEADSQCEDRIASGSRAVIEDLESSLKKSFAKKKTKPKAEKPWWDWGLLG